MNFINWENGSTIFMNFIWIGSHAPENQTRLFLRHERNIFGQNIDLRPTWSSAVTMATTYCRYKYGCFCSSPQVTYLYTKNEGGLKVFISKFAPLSWRIALNYENNSHFWDKRWLYVSEKRIKWDLCSFAYWLVRWTTFWIERFGGQATCFGKTSLLSKFPGLQRRS